MDRDGWLLIDMETTNKIKRMIGMTKIGWLFEQEKQEEIAFIVSSFSQEDIETIRREIAANTDNG